MLDTHAFLWFRLDDPRLSNTAKGAIADPDNTAWVSPASFWEIAIKIGIGKYRIEADFTQFWEQGLEQAGFRLLPISVRHAATLLNLPHHHRDPFDRMLVAQSMAERLDLVSADAVFDAYGVHRIW